MGSKTQVAMAQVDFTRPRGPADSWSGSATTTPTSLLRMNELADSDSLLKLDHRHEELLVKLDSLCRELETALANLIPKSGEPQLQEAA